MTNPPEVPTTERVAASEWHCCNPMREPLTRVCEQHVANRFHCPDALIDYAPKFDEYSLIVHDGGSSLVPIAFCPWCGAKLPESKRDRWFEEMRARGIDPWADRSGSVRDRRVVPRRHVRLIDSSTPQVAAKASRPWQGASPPQRHRASARSPTRDGDLLITPSLADDSRLSSHP